MNEREELEALRRMAELEARSGASAAPDQPSAAPAPSMLSMFKDEAMTSLPGGLVRGLKDIVDTGAEYLSKAASPEESARVKASNEQGKQDFKDAQDRAGAGGSGITRVAGNVVATAPIGGILAGALSKVPGVAAKLPSIVDAVRTSGMTAGGRVGLSSLPARMIGGAVTGGATAAAVNPDDAKTGALIGGLFPAAGMAVKGVGSAVGNMLRPADNADLARTALNKYGIPVGMSDVTQNRVVKAARSIMNDAPLTGGIGARQNDAKQAAFNKAVGGTFGAPEAKLTTKVIDDAKKRMGAEFDRIWGGNSLKVAPNMVDRLTELRTMSDKLPRNEGASLAAEVDDIFSKMVPDANGDLIIPGDVANKFQSYLRRRAEGSSGLKNELSDLRQVIISAFNESVSPQDVAALTKNRGQYKAFKTVEPLLNAAEAGVAGRMPGDVPAALLPQVVNRSYKQAGGAPLTELSQIGSRFLVDRTAQTGGSARAALQNGMIGSMLGFGAMSNPTTLAAVPVAAALNKALGSPSVARKVLNTNPDSLAAALEAALPLSYRAAPVIGAQ